MRLLRSKTDSDKPLMVLLDNCSIHKAKKVADYFKSANIVPLWNVPYCPQYNGIELVWARAKKNFRNKVLEIKTGQADGRPLATVVDEVMRDLPPKLVAACCRHSRELLIPSAGSSTAPNQL